VYFEISVYGYQQDRELMEEQGDPGRRTLGWPKHKNARPEDNRNTMQ
jgi:hypothetical protein